MRNFYKHQDKASSKSRRQVFWLTFAVMGTAAVTSVVLVYLALLGCSGITIQTAKGLVDLSVFLRGFPAAVEIMLVISTVLVTICIAGKSYLKIRQLREGGGAVVAEDLGGTIIEESDQLDLKSRQLLNVVQEIAISASIPPPPVYCMQHEPAINAFAAGYTPQDAIICVTRGCLKELNRDQLQGVIAHEFSHILNGDMRQNIRTIGVLHGILFVIETAEASWRTAWEMWESPDLSGASVKVGIAMFFFAAFLWPVGVVGYFFATIAKAGISQQREYLADATAVELARNPLGIANALKRIAGFDHGTRVRSPMAVEASHLFFANGMSLSRLLSTHPPIADRIRRLDPLWDGVPEYEDDASKYEYSGIYEGTMNFASKSQSKESTVSELDDDGRSMFTDGSEKESAHRYTVASSLPSDLVSIARDPLAAGSTIIALRSSTTTPTECPTSETQKLVDALTQTIADLTTDERLFLLDEAIAALTEGRGDEAFARELLEIAERHPMSLYEFAWNYMAERLARDLLGMESPKPRFSTLHKAAPSCSVAVSALVHAGGNVGPAGEYAFRRGAAHLELPEAHYLTPDLCTLEDLKIAVETLCLAAPSAKKRVCRTISACITADAEINDDEALIVRGIVSKLGYPIPQILPGHPVTPGA